MSAQADQELLGNERPDHTARLLGAVPPSHGPQILSTLDDAGDGLEDPGRPGARSAPIRNSPTSTTSSRTGPFGSGSA